MDELIGAAEYVIQDLRQKWRDMQEQEPLWSVVQGFFHAVDWTEPWILGLLGVLTCYILLAVLTRKHMGMQTALFLVAALTVWMGERINLAASQHWELFSSQNYFDRRGVFFTAVVSLPLLVAMFIILINFLLSNAALLVQAKRKELKHKARLRQAQEQAQGKAQAEQEGKKEL